jgi:hypothetical protein
MNRKQQSVLLAGLLALALAGCSSTRGSSDGTGGGATGSGMGASGSMGSGTSGGTAATGGTEATGGAGSMAGTGGSMAAPAPGPAGSPMPAGAPNAVVMLIEVAPRPAGAGAAGTAVGGSGTAGATGSSMGDEKVYRITLRMDDGTTRIVTQDKAPTFHSGDRVNMTDGMVTQ